MGKDGAKCSHKRAAEGAPKKESENVPFWSHPSRGSGELSPRREHNFHQFSWLAFGPHFGPLLDAIWDQVACLCRPKGAKERAKESQKRVPKLGPFFEPLEAAFQRPADAMLRTGFP